MGNNVLQNVNNKTREFAHTTEMSILKLSLRYPHPANTVLELRSYTMHQQYPTLQLPTDAHNVKKRRVIKTF